MQVLLYLNATGLMWENAEKFGAMLIFAEHRYYGESLPFGDKTFEHMLWLTSEQALADYATLLRTFKKDQNLENAPVIGFGGSYGGMLATWGRLKYPHVWLPLILYPRWSENVGRTYPCIQNAKK
jgi:lysosomal Pro-X carboxypeptidase